MSAMVAALTPLVAAMLSTDGLIPPPARTPVAIGERWRDVRPDPSTPLGSSQTDCPAAGWNGQEDRQEGREGQGESSKPRETPVGIPLGRSPVAAPGPGHAHRLPRAVSRRPPRIRSLGGPRGGRCGSRHRETAGRIAGEIRNAVDFQIEAELGSDDPVARRLRQLPAARRRAGPGRPLQAALQPRREHQLDQPRFRLSFTRRQPAGAGPRPRHHGARTRAGSRARIRGRASSITMAATPGLRTPRDASTAGAHLPARVTFQPFRAEKSWRNDFQVGAAFTRSTLEEGFPDLRGRTASTSRFFRPDVWVEGHRRRVGAEAAVAAQAVLDQIRIHARYRRAPRAERGRYGSRRSSPPAGTWSGTWALTGEPKVNGLDTPTPPGVPGRLRCR